MQAIKFIFLFHFSLAGISYAQDCEHEYKRWQEFLGKAESYSEVSARAGAIGMGAGSFFGPLGGLAGLGTGAIPAGISARYQHMAEDAKIDYEKCLQRVATKRNERLARENRERARKIAEEKAEEVKNNREEINNFEI